MIRAAKVWKWVWATMVGVGAAAGSASATNVCGPISADTTWNLAGSPYTLTCDVRVLTGATLTIDPGVVVRFEHNTALVAEGGVVSAIGTSGSGTILFQTVYILDRGAGTRVQGGKIHVEHAVFSGLQSGVELVCCGSPFDPPLRVDHCIFDSNQNGISGYTLPFSLITNSLFTNNQVAAGQAYQRYVNCQFQSNVDALPYAESVSLEDCELSGNNVAFASSTGNNMIARRCHFHGNQVAMDRVTHIERCLIEFNQVGVRITTPYMAFFECNDIHSNFTWDVEMNTNVTISAPNNWWGTTSTTAIDAVIKDGFDQIGLGFLQYGPILPGPQQTTSTCACTVPVFNVHPATQSVYSGGTAVLTAGATATGTPSYQWFRYGVPLTNSFRFSGVTTPTLTISPVARPGSESSWTDAGLYQCRATNVCGTAWSNTAFLSTPICTADFNQSGMVTIQDLFDFLGVYFAGCP
ncbi:MAG: immunoglobulin domain-containing protein [Phycisphaerales bacterium]